MSHFELFLQKILRHLNKLMNPRVSTILRYLCDILVRGGKEVISQDVASLQADNFLNEFLGKFMNNKIINQFWQRLV